MLANRRGQRVALGGLVLQAALVGLMLALWWFTQATAAWPALWLVVAPVPIWLLTLILFYCRYLERREARELQELAARGGDRASIFAAEGPDGQPLRLAANRVRWMERYLVPVFTLLLAGYHVALGILLLGSAGPADTVAFAQNASAWMFASVGLAFVAFLFSRYATGMAKGEAWQLLRAPGSYLFTNSLVFLLLAGVLAAEYYRSKIFGEVVTYVLPGFMLIIGAELVLNFVLDLYRPRVPGAGRRFSYDSRLLNLIASPESIGHSIAEALNYQFGFEVSSTWFYRLLQRALVPLLFVGAVVVWLMTSVVAVEEGQQYVVLHWGKRHPQRVLTPRARPYLIWPWPIDTARKFDTGKIHEIVLGAGGHREEEFVRGRRIYLWTEEHGTHDELDTLVAMPPRAGEGPQEEEGQEEKVPSVSLIKLLVGVYYRIADPYKFGYTVTDAHKLLEAIAHREMVRYAASATLDEPVPREESEDRPGGPPGRPPVERDDAGGEVSARPEAIMSFGRERAAKDLHKRIAQAASRAELDLGVEIVRVKILGCHPPKEAVPAFEKVIAAERDRDRRRYAAQAEANQLLAAVAGDPEHALRLSQAILFLQELERLANLRRTGGDLAGRVAEVILRTKDQIERLKKEIELERRLGKISKTSRTAAQRLLERQETFLQLLERIQADAKQFLLSDDLAKARKAAEGLFEGIQGQAAVTISQARAYQWKKEFRERARAETFPVQMLGLRAAPSLYQLDKYLDVLTQGMKEQRKYILGLDRKRVEVWLNLEQPPGSIGDIPLGRGQ